MPVQHLLACACKGHFLMQHGIHVSVTTPAIPVLYIQGVKAALLCQLTASVALPLHLMSSNKPQPCIPSSPAALSASPSCMPPPQYFFLSRNSDLNYLTLLFLVHGQAEREWPGEGYQQKALRTCAALWEHCINKHTFIPLLGDWVGGPGDRMGPLPDICYYDITRPSDFCLDHFLTFALVPP